MKRKVRIQPKSISQSQTSAPKTPLETTFSDHIGELRRRIFFVLLAFIGASSLAYNYRDDLMRLIMQPLAGEKLVYLTPGGGFNFIFQISLYAGLIAAAPMLIYQLYGFIRPALPKKAQRSSLVVVLVAFLLMLAGVAFGYFVAIPSALTFLSTFAGEAVSPNLTAESYLSFFLAYVAGLGVLFELPLLLLFLHWIHPMTPGSLLKSERFVIVFAFIAAALITPTPDVMNQAMIAVPLIAIYQLGVIVVLVAIRRDRRQFRKMGRAVQATDPIQPQQAARETIFPAKSIAVSSKAPQPESRSTVISGSAGSLRSKGRTVDGFLPVRSRPQPIIRPPVRSVVSARVSRPQPHRRSLSVDGLS